MDLVKTIMNATDVGTLKSIADKLDLEEHVVRVGIFSMLPEVTAGLEQNVQADGGADALAGALDKGNHDSYLDDPNAIVTDSATEDGNKILGHALGSKDKSREVAKTAADSTGIDLGKLKKMLPMVAALAMGGIKRTASPGDKAQSDSGDGETKSSGGGLASQLGSLLGSDGVKSAISKLF